MNIRHLNPWVNFDRTRPILQPKRNNLSYEELDGVIYVGQNLTQTAPEASLSGQLSPLLYYTRLDQALLLWAIAVAIIFLTAQFRAFDWHQQAKLWSGLTLATLLLSSIRAWPWAAAQNLRWLIYWWGGLMVVGLGLTDWGIYGSVAPLLRNLCPLWLSLSALGYGVTAVGMGSRALLGIVVIHGIALGLLQLWPAWLFLITGSAIAGCLLLLAQLQWDHR